MQKKTSIGGQAVIEGIMMKGPKKTALAVRLPNGSIDVEYISENHLKDRFPIFGAPVLRGVVGFVESMITGYGAMMKSAEKSGFTDIDEEDTIEKELELKKETASGQADRADTAVDESAAETAETAEATAVAEEGAESVAESAETAAAAAETEESAAAEKPEAPEESSANTENEKIAEKKPTSKFVNVLMVVAAVLGVALGVVLFMYLPALLFDLTNRAAGGSLSPFKAVFEGVLKMTIFLCYIVAVSKMKDIHRVFQYHGAEHKTIFCYEKGLPLTVENVRVQSRFHPRCGTSFMVLMLVVGILLGVILTWCFPSLQQSSFRPVWVAIKILILPLICGIGYELLKFCGRHDNALTKVIAAPGLLMQHITTQEPEDDMIEVAIESLKAVIPENPEEDVW